MVVDTAVAVLVPVGVPLAVGFGVVVGVGVTLAEDTGLSARVGSGDGDGDAMLKVADADGVVLGFIVRVAAGVDPVADPVGDGVDVGLVVGLEVGLDVGLADGLGLAVGVPVADGVGVGVGVVGVAVGAVGDGDELGVSSGSHDAPAGVVAALAGEAFAATARQAPEAAVIRTVPAISVTVAGRACAKRMKRPTSPARYCCGTPSSVWRGSFLPRYATYWTSSALRGATRPFTRLTALIHCQTQLVSRMVNL
ncbi:MAG TPA: hypothetical protein VIZ43_07055 [Trebonia sp.]